MTDNLKPEVRSYNMSRIRSNDTLPEEKVRKYLFKKGFRYRKNDKKMCGHPDIVLPKYRTVIFVNGCFWHKHDCGKFVLPKTNTEYWESKIKKNVERDNRVQKELKEAGWNIIVVWECELTKNVFEKRVNLLEEEIINAKRLKDE